MTEEELWRERAEQAEADRDHEETVTGLFKEVQRVRRERDEVRGKVTDLHAEQEFQEFHAEKTKDALTDAKADNGRALVVIQKHRLHRSDQRRLLSAPGHRSQGRLRLCGFEGQAPR